MTDVILRHHAQPAGDFTEFRLAGKPNQLRQLLNYKLSQFFFAEIVQIWLQCPAYEHAQQDIALRRSPRELNARHAARDDPASFDCRHDKAETIEWMTDLVAPRAHNRYTASGVRNSSDKRSQFTINICQQP